MENPKIVIISLIKNEDIYIRKILDNVIDFCDEMIILDNMSTDNTYDTVSKFALEYPEKVQLHRLDRYTQSGNYIRKYIDTKTWILSVDGDELYDSKGLMRMRKEILEGKYQDKWVVSGYFLNCTNVDWDNQKATGHMSPPSRPCVRLYNFSAIKRWSMKKQRLHGRKPRFNSGYCLNSRYSMHEHLKWEDAYLRYLHLCFIERSSESNDKCRANPTEVTIGRNNPRYKKQKYMLGGIEYSRYR